MPFVYKYIDKSDGVVKYVGIVCRNGDNSLHKRVKEHSHNDKWAKSHNWIVKYIEVETKGEAHALEGHFISYYKSFEWFNKAKSDYGLLSFVDSESFEWIDFNEDEDVLNQYYVTPNDFVGYKKKKEMVSRYCNDIPKNTDEWITQMLWVHYEIEQRIKKIKEVEKKILFMIECGKTVPGRDIYADLKEIQDHISLMEKYQPLGF